MALDDRDRSFEKALARHLRYTAPAGGETGALSSSALPCPDPEILAAYHDGSLTPDERVLWKPHVLSCDRCQLVLEHLATPLDVPVALESDEAVPAVTARQPVLQPQPAASAARSASPASIAIARPRKAYFRWLVPAGAIAAGVLAFAVLRESRSPRTVSTDAIEVADDRQPAPAPPPQSTSSAARAGAAENTKKTEQANEALSREKNLPLAAPSGATASGTSSRSDALLKEQRSREQTVAPAQNQYAPSPSLSHGPRVSQQQQQQEQMASRAVNGALRDAKKDKAEADAQLAQEGKDLAAKVAPPLPASAGQAGYLGDNLITPSSKAAGRVAGPPPAAPPPPPPPKPAETQGAPANAEISAITTNSGSYAISSQLDSSAKMRATILQSPHVFSAPGGKVLWRVGPAGSLERSTNKGKDWTAQDSGVVTDLMSGSAPSARVSWIVGAAGTILRTTDGGAHWTRLVSPASGELAGIRAADGLHAYIWFAPDPRTALIPSFRTSDGGLTWTPVPNE